MRTEKEFDECKSKSTARNWRFLWFALVALVLSGCSAAHYRRQADKDVYKIIQQAEQRVFGKTNQFDIETRYSTRKPEEISPAELIEDRLRTNEQALTIEGALELAFNNSRRYQAEKERLYLTALTLTGERYAFSPQFFAGSSVNLDRFSDREVALNVDNRVGVSQLLKSGGRVGVTLANDILRYYTGSPRRSVVSLASINLAQPLLRGFGRNNPAVESLTQAERNVIYAVRNHAFFQDQYALDVVNDYFNLLAQKDVIRNRYTNYLSRVDATKRLANRAHDRERPMDVDQARQAELSAKNNYINAVAGYRNSLDQFKIELGLPVDTKVYLDDNALLEVENNGLVPVLLDPNQAFRLAVDKQLPILNAIDQFEDSKRKIRLAADRFKPDLNLLADASLESERPTDYTRFDPDEVRAGVGLELDLPIDRLRERNNYRATLISFETELRDLTLTLDSLKDNIERGLRTLEQRRQNYEIQKNALALANRRVESTTALIQAGRAEVRDLVEAQDAQIAAQNSVTDALVDYQAARLQLMLDIGALNTDLSQFWLKNHLDTFLPETGQTLARPVEGDQSVIPPDTFFNN